MIEKDHVVSIHYTLTNDAGEVVDTSDGREPLNYLHGHRNIVPGLENALEGRAVGDQLNVVVPPEQGYGMREESQMQTVPREEINLPDLEEGMMLQVRTPQGPIRVTVAKLTTEEVTLDANHELAGETLHFAVEIMNVRPAEPGELEQGHAQ